MKNQFGLPCDQFSICFDFKVHAQNKEKAKTTKSTYNSQHDKTTYQTNGIEYMQYILIGKDTPTEYGKECVVQCTIAFSMFTIYI